MERWEEELLTPTVRRKVSIAILKAPAPGDWLEAITMSAGDIPMEQPVHGVKMLQLRYGQLSSLATLAA